MDSSPPCRARSFALPCAVRLEVPGAPGCVSSGTPSRSRSWRREGVRREVVSVASVSVACSFVPVVPSALCASCCPAAVRPCLASLESPFSTAGGLPAAASSAFGSSLVPVAASPLRASCSSLTHSGVSERGCASKSACGASSNPSGAPEGLRSFLDDFAMAGIWAESDEKARQNSHEKRLAVGLPPVPVTAAFASASRRNRNGDVCAGPFHETQTVGEDGW